MSLSFTFLSWLDAFLHLVVVVAQWMFCMHYSFTGRTKNIFKHHWLLKLLRLTWNIVSSFYFTKIQLWRLFSAFISLKYNYGTKISKILKFLAIVSWIYGQLWLQTIPFHKNVVSRGKRDTTQWIWFDI